MLVEVRDVKAYYYLKGSAVRAVDGVSLSVERNEVLGIIGESGSGKSTFANVLMMNVQPPLRLVGGSIVLDGVELSKLSRGEVKKNIWGVKVSMIPQAAMNALMPTKRVIDFIKDVVKHHQEDLSNEEIVSMARRRFEELNLDPRALYMYPFELSGGMRQRAVIAVSTLLNPKLLIADEPTSALDVSTQKQVIKTLLDLRRSKIVESIVFITHEIAVARQVADRVAVMYAGKIVEVGSIEDIIYDPLHPYTKALIGSVITHEPEIRKRGLSYIPGEPPDLSNPPSGCRFHPRCPLAMDICRKAEPQLIEVGKGRLVACHLYGK